MDHDVEVSQVVFMWNGADSRDSDLKESVTCLCRSSRYTYGSAISRSVSFTILFGRAAIFAREIQLKQIVQTNRERRSAVDIYLSKISRNFFVLIRSIKAEGPRT